jgi:hypothetical protein
VFVGQDLLQGYFLPFYICFSIALWHPAFLYLPSTAKYYCTLPFHDRSQFIMCFIGVFLCGTCINITCFCYIQIYRYYKRLKRNVRENMNSSLVTNNSAKKEDDTEFKILWTTILLVGWTFIGISSLSLIE